MDTIINIYNTKDVPFGQLSNNYLHSMVIDDKRWNTVTNYTLSNMLTTPLYKSIIQYADINKGSKKAKIADKVQEIIQNIETTTQTKLTKEDKLRIRKGVKTQPMNIYDLFNYYLGLERFETLRTATEKAYNAKISENPDLQDILLSTDNRPILYMSSNSNLGEGTDGEGENVIGKILMQIRHNIRIQANESRRSEETQLLETQIFNIYKAYIILQKEISTGNNLLDYVNKNPEDIISFYIENRLEEKEESIDIDFPLRSPEVRDAETKNYRYLHKNSIDSQQSDTEDPISPPNKTLESLGLNDSMKSIIIDMYNKGKFPIIKKELSNPGYMVNYMMKKSIPIVKRIIESKRINCIVTLYTEYVIAEQNPSWDSEKVKQEASLLFQSLYNSDQKELKRILSLSLEKQSIAKGDYDQLVINKYNDFNNRVIRIYKEGKFPPELSQKIETALNNLKLPDDTPEQPNEEEPEEEPAEETDEETDEELSHTDSSSGSLDINDPIVKELATDEKKRKIELLEKLEKYTGLNAFDKYKNLSNEKLEKEVLRYELSPSNKNVIEIALGSDPNTLKSFLLKKLEYYTGSNKIKKYTDWDNDRLQKELFKYEGNEATKEPKAAGEWVVKIKHKNNKVEILHKSPTRPAKEELEKLLKKYNRTKSKDIKTNQLTINWIPDKKAFKKTKPVTFEEVPQKITKQVGFTKEKGNPIYIYAEIEKNEPQFQPFSPIYEKVVTINNPETGENKTFIENFTIDSVNYPSVSIYLTTMLLTQTGQRINLQQNLVKGRSLSDARELLLKPIEDASTWWSNSQRSFLSPEEADNIYEKENLKTFTELQETFTLIAMRKKFEDINFRLLLLLTGDAQLIWDDKEDSFLGIGTEEEPGQNIVGKILMDFREHFSTQDPIIFPIVSKYSLENFISKDEFMLSWITMRVTDMSNTVYRFQTYLENVTSQQEEVDERFVKHVIDNVFNPCSKLIAMSNIIDLPVPEFFKDIVSSLVSIHMKIDPKLQEELELIKEQEKTIESKYQNIFDVKTFSPKKEFNVIEFAKKQSQTLSKFLQTNPTQEQLQVFYAKQEKDSKKAKLEQRIQFQLQEQPLTQELGIESKQRLEFQQLLSQINKPELSPEEIIKQIDRFEEDQLEQLNNPDSIKAIREKWLNEQLQTNISYLTETLELTESQADERLTKLEELYSNWNREKYTRKKLKKYPSLSPEKLEQKIDMHLESIQEKKESLKQSKEYAKEVNVKIEALKKQYKRDLKKLKKEQDMTSNFTEKLTTITYKDINPSKLDDKKYIFKVLSEYQRLYPNYFKEPISIDDDISELKDLYTIYSKRVPQIKIPKIKQTEQIIPSQKYKLELSELKQKQSESRKEFIQGLFKTQLSTKEKNEQIQQLMEKQHKDLLKYYSIEQPLKKTKAQSLEEKNQYNKEKEELKLRKMRINKSKKDEITYRNKLIDDISKVYWNRIATMLVFLLDNIKDVNQQDIRKAIASIETLNSSSDTKCHNIANLDNDVDNCIASAMSNLLIGIHQKFKEQYGEDIPFDTPDIDLAASIILNKEIPKKNIEEILLDPEIGEELIDDKLEDDFAAEDSFENDDYGDDFENDFDMDEEQNSGGSASFGMKRKKGKQINSNLEQVKIIIRQIIGSQPSNLNSLAVYFIEKINTIKTFKMSERVKQNRINFFASIR